MESETLQQTNMTELKPIPTILCAVLSSVSKPDYLQYAAPRGAEEI